MPFSADSRISECTVWQALTSRPRVGECAISSLESLESSLASNNFCALPPDSRRAVRGRACTDDIVLIDHLGGGGPHFFARNRHELDRISRLSWRSSRGFRQLTFRRPNHSNSDPMESPVDRAAAAWAIGRSVISSPRSSTLPLVQGHSPARKSANCC